MARQTVAAFCENVEHAIVAWDWVAKVWVCETCALPVPETRSEVGHGQ